MGGNLKILIIAAEVAPFAKVGGLADVAGALPRALRALGHDVRVAMPCYRMIEDDPSFGIEDLIGPFPVPIHESRTGTAWVRQTRIAGDIPVYLIAGHRHFADASDSSRVYAADVDPYIFFDRAVTAFVPRLVPSWCPDVVHCNDWHTGLIPVYLSEECRAHPTWAETASVFTIHNLAYQGDQPYQALRDAGLRPELFRFDMLESYGRMNFLKGGVVFSDVTNTVSETYAREIQTPQYGCGLDGLMRYLAGQGRLRGIVNGIDFDAYDPMTDARIASRYGAGKRAGKARCRKALQKELGLGDCSGPVIGIVSRLAEQKGFDLIQSAMPSILEMPVQFVLLGMGDPELERYFTELAASRAGQVAVRVVFDADLAQRIYAGADLFLMPSRFEPCGLGQLMSLRYGTPPIVRLTGGLADTITEADAAAGTGYGFTFEEPTVAAMLAAIRRAVGLFGDAPAWSALVNRALRADFSWGRSAPGYVRMYEDAISRRRTSCATI